MQKLNSPDALKEISRECRIEIIKMLSKAGSGHPGGSLSAIDIMTTLFFGKMHWDPSNSAMEDRDRFILSKGHGVPALYAVLAKAGAIPLDELQTLRHVNSRLQGHPDRHLLPFVEASTGSLGQGLSIAQGIALALKLKNSKAHVYCLLGDGEIQEGQVWETIMSAPKFKLGNLTAIVDNNNGQIDGHVTEIMDLQPLKEKWGSFRWHVQEINGHSIEEISRAVDHAQKISDVPHVIIAKTIKGKGVSFMENNIGWHGVTPNPEETARALSELKRGTPS